MEWWAYILYFYSFLTLVEYNMYLHSFQKFVTVFELITNSLCSQTQQQKLQP